MSALKALSTFIEAAIMGIVDHSDNVRIETIESGSKSITIIVHCDPRDLKFVYSRLRAIKFISIAIAQRFKCIVNLIVNE